MRPEILTQAALLALGGNCPRHFLGLTEDPEQTDPHDDPASLALHRQVTDEMARIRPLAEAFPGCLAVSDPNQLQGDIPHQT